MDFLVLMCIIIFNLFLQQLVVGNRHLERTCMYQFDNINGVRNLVVEKLSESASIFDLSAQVGGNFINLRVLVIDNIYTVIF